MEDRDQKSRDVDRSLVSGIAWEAVVRWGSQILSWVATMVVARLLSLADYGLVGMAMVYMGFVEVFAGAGLGASIIQSRRLSDDDRAQISGLAVIVGVLLFLISAAAAPLVALFFREPAVQKIITIMGISFVIGAFGIVPESLLRRDLRFKLVALVGGVGTISGIIITLSLAIYGAGYWALVFGPMGGRLIANVVVIVKRPHPIRWPRDLVRIGREVTMGLRVVGASLSWYFYSNADFIIAGRVLGKQQLGSYSFAWNIASMPVERIATTLNRVTLSVFSAVQDDFAALRRYLKNIIEGLAFFTFPASVGLALVGDQIVLVALTEKWGSAIVPLQLLALYAGFRTMAPVLNHVLLATGHDRRSLRFNLLAAVVLPVAFVVGSRWGTVGIALGWVVSYPLIAIPYMFNYTIRVIEMKPSEFYGAMLPALSGTLVMAGAVLGSRLVFTESLPMAVGLLINVAIGAATYAGFMWFTYGKRLREMKAFLSQVRRA